MTNHATMAPIRAHDDECILVCPFEDAGDVDACHVMHACWCAEDDEDVTVTP